MWKTKQSNEFIYRYNIWHHFYKSSIDKITKIAILYLYRFCCAQNCANLFTVTHFYYINRIAIISLNHQNNVFSDITVSFRVCEYVEQQGSWPMSIWSATSKCDCHIDQRLFFTIERMCYRISMHIRSERKEVYLLSRYKLNI
jgi:hypothetical protein